MYRQYSKYEVEQAGKESTEKKRSEENRREKKNIKQKREETDLNLFKEITRRRD